MSGICEIAVTYQPAKPGEGFHRFAKLSTPCYLWSKSGKDDTISDISVLTGDEPTPDGFTKIDVDLTKGRADKPVFLAYCTGGDDGPIADFKVVDSEQPVGEGFVRLETDLEGGLFARVKYLCYKSEAATKSRGYAIGDHIDCLDSVQKWCMGQVAAVRGETHVKVHYRGWSDKWDEWVAVDSDRIAPFRTHTSGNTGPPGNREDFLLEGEEVDEFLDISKRLAKLVITLEDGRQLTEEEEEFVTEKVIPELESLLNAVIHDMKLLQPVVDFFENFLLLVINSLKTDEDVSTELLRCLHGLFGGDAAMKKFFTKFGVGSDDECLESPRFAIRKSPRRGTEPTSSYVIQFINFFGNNDGFQLFLRRSGPRDTEDETSPPPISVRSLQHLLQCVLGCLTHLDKQFAKRFVVQLKDAIQERFRNLCDEDIKGTQRDMVSYIRETVERLLKQISADSDQFVEEFKLMLALRFIRCPFLEKQIFGVGELKDILDAVSRRDRSLYSRYTPSYNFNSPPRQAAAKFLTTKFMVKWLQDERLVRLMLDPAAHSELVKRTPIVLMFLAKNDALTEEHLGALWSAWQEKHESIVRVVFQAIAELSSELSSSHLNYLFARIEEIAQKDYTGLTVQFIRTFTANAIKSTSNNRKEKKWYGLDIFWGMMQDKCTLDGDLIALAQQFLVEQLQEPECEAVRLTFVERCMANLKANESVVQSVTLLQHIMDYLPETRRHRSEVVTSQLISKLDKNSDLMNIIFQCVRHYRDEALQQLNGKTRQPVEDRIFVGRETHSVYMQRLINFLHYCYVRAELEFGPSEVSMLWNSFVAKPASRADPDRLFEWLKALCEEPRCAALTPATTQLIFSDYLCANDLFVPEDCTLMGFHCFESFCRTVNFLEERIDDQFEPKRFKVRAHPLSGVESLWAIAARAADDEVATAAKVFLQRLHVQLDPKTVERSDVIEIFLAKSTEVLRECHQNILAEKDIAANERAIGRVLDLLGGFLNNLDSRLDPDRLYDRGIKITIEFTARKGRGQQLSFDPTSRQHEPFERFRNDVASHLHVSPDLLRIRSNCRVLYQDCNDTNLRDLCFGDPIIVQELDKSEADSDKTKTTADIDGRHILANHQEYFDLLFTLLDLGGELGQKVWELIQTLPRNQGLSKRITETEKWKAKPDFNEMLSVEQPPKLLYSLQIVAECMLKKSPTRPHTIAGDRTPDSSAPLDSDWAREFDARGGFAFLLGGVLSRPEITAVEAGGQVERRCLALTLELLSEMLFVKKLPVAVEHFESQDYSSLTDVLLRCMYEACKVVDANEPRVDREDSRSSDSSGPVEYNDRRRGSARNTHGGQNRSPGRPGGGYKSATAVEGEPPAGPQEPSVQGKIVRHARRIILICVSHEPKMGDRILEFDGLKDMISSGLLSNPVVNLRDSLRISIKTICDYLKEVDTRRSPHEVFLTALLGCLNEIDTRSAFCSEYFALIQELLASKLHDASEHLEAGRIVQQIVSKIRQHPIIEQRATDDDHVIRGLLSLCAALKAEQRTEKEAGHTEASEGTAQKEKEAGHAELTGETLEKVAGRTERTEKKHDDPPEIFSEAGEADPELVAEIFEKCLFQLPSSSSGIRPPKCKSRESRQAAFSLLRELCMHSDANLHRLALLMVPFHQPPPVKSGAAASEVAGRGGLAGRGRSAQGGMSWELMGRPDEKSETGYVGIKNLGCICYMNSFFQQLYMMPDLRSDVLKISDEKLVRTEESVTHQLQHILAFLQESEKQFCDPSSFCHSFKDFDGQPTNVSQQMDAHEFVSVLFDRIDTQLKDTKHSQLLQRHMGGTLAQQIICKDCPHRSERDEPFYYISVQIQGRKNLAECLERYVEGDMLEGDNKYVCEGCGDKKVDALKRTCVKQLPRVLCIHLQRFEFNYDTMQRIKLNDRCEFPVVLDMRPYTREGLAEPEKESRDADGIEEGEDAAEGKDDNAEEPKSKDSPALHPDSYYKYHLVGVLIHMGSANGGHYYSFIKERGPSGSEAPSPSSSSPADLGRWFEFNDTLVREMDPATLGDECFGGEEVYQHMGGATHEKRRNAYMLFYERFDAPPVSEIEEVTSNGPTTKKRMAFADVVSVVKTIQQVPRPKGPVKVPIPKEIFEEIWDENLTYWREKWVLNPDYFDFVWDAMGSHSPTPCLTLPQAEVRPASSSSVAVIRVCTLFVLETVARARAKEDSYRSRAAAKMRLPRIEDWIQRLKKLYESSVPSCVWLLSRFADPTCPWALELLLESRSGELRLAVTGLLRQVLSVVVELEGQEPAHPLLFEAAKVVEEEEESDSSEVAGEDKKPAPPSLLSERFAASLLALLPTAYQRRDRFVAYFRLLAHYAKLSTRAAHFLLKEGLVESLCDLYLGESSPSPLIEVPKDHKGRRRIICDPYFVIDWTEWLACISTVACSSASPSDPSSDLPPLPDAARALLYSPAFVQPVMLESLNERCGRMVAKVLCHWCREDWEHSDSIIGLIMEGIDTHDFEEIRYYFRPLSLLLAMEDSLQKRRVETAMDSLVGVMEVQKQFFYATYMCLDHLVRLAKTNPLCRQWLNEHSSKTAWMEEWLTDFSTVPSYTDRRIRQYKSNDRSSRSYINNLQQTKLLVCLELIRGGQDLMSGGAEDSEPDLSDRVFKVGDTVDCQDTMRKWCVAVVKEVEGDRVNVSYSDWSDRWNEWLSIEDPRLQPAGKHTRSPRRASRGQAYQRRYNGDQLDDAGGRDSPRY
eukprot:294895_1